MIGQSILSSMSLTLVLIGQFNQNVKPNHLFFWPWERISHGPISLKIVVVGDLCDFAQVPIFYEQFNHFMNSQNIGIIHKILE